MEEAEGNLNKLASLFETPEVSLNFNKPLNKEKTVCPRCGKESNYSAKSKPVYFTKNKHRLEVSAEIQDIQEIFSLGWMSRGRLKISFPLYETVVFNLKKGRTYLKLHNTSGTVYIVSDITQKPETWTDGVLYNAFHLI